MQRLKAIFLSAYQIIFVAWYQYETLPILIYLKASTHRICPGKSEQLQNVGYCVQGGNLTLFTTILGLQFWLTDKHFKDGKVGDGMRLNLNKSDIFQNQSIGKLYSSHGSNCFLLQGIIQEHERFLFHKYSSLQKNSFKVNIFFAGLCGWQKFRMQNGIKGSHLVYFQLVVSCKAFISDIYNMSSESYTIGR